MTAISGSYQEALSFYCRSGYKELLTEHVKKMMSFDRDSRLIKLGQSQSPDFELGLRIAIAFHDVGKIPFSDKRDLDAFYRGETLIFTGHEFLSFFLLERALLPQVAGLQKSTGEAAKLSVLLHHHPQNIATRFKALSSRALSLKHQNPLIIRKGPVISYIEELESMGLLDKAPASDIKRNLESSLKDEVEVSQVVTGSFVSKITDYLEGRRFILYKNSLNVFMPMLLSLITMDYVSALERNKCEGRSESRFSEVALEFYRYYLAKS